MLFFNRLVGKYIIVISRYKFVQQIIKKSTELNKTENNKYYIKMYFYYI
jgi:hypothetical protein